MSQVTVNGSGVGSWFGLAVNGGDSPQGPPRDKAVWCLRRGVRPNPWPAHWRVKQAGSTWSDQALPDHWVYPVNGSSNRT